MHRAKPVHIILLVILIIIVLLTIAALTMEPVNAPRIKITSGLDKVPVEYTLLPKKWNKTVTDSPHYREILFEKTLAGFLPTVSNKDKITFHFGLFKPDSITLMVDYYTSLILSSLMEPVPVPLDGYSFTHPPAPAGLPAYSGPRFYVLTCTWGENVAQYAFAVNLADEDEQLTEVPGLSLPDPAKVQKLTISPLMSTATHLEDAQSREKAINLLQAADLRPIPPEEAAGLQAEDPGNHTVDGTPYSRNILIDIYIKDSPEDILTVHLYGDMIKIGNGYYSNSTLTNDFIALLHEFHAGLQSEDVPEAAE